MYTFGDFSQNSEGLDLIKSLNINNDKLGIFPKQSNSLKHANQTIPKETLSSTNQISLENANVSEVSSVGVAIKNAWAKPLKLTSELNSAPTNNKNTLNGVGNERDLSNKNDVTNSIVTPNNVAGSESCEIQIPDIFANQIGLCAFGGANRISLLNTNTENTTASDATSNSVSLFVCKTPSQQDDDHNNKQRATLCFTPRGIANHANCCYLNCGLQLLLYCPPFYALLKHIRRALSQLFANPPLRLAAPIRARQSQPTVLDILLNFTSDFIGFSSANKSAAANQDAALPCLELLHKLRFAKNQFQDCEEFVTKLITCLHEELSAMQSSALQSNLPANGVNENDQEFAEDDEEDVELSASSWTQVGRSGKSKISTKQSGHNELSAFNFLSGQIVSIRKNVFSSNQHQQPLIGQSQSATNHNQQPNATQQRFFVLPLDIQHGEVHDLTSALRNFSLRHHVAAASAQIGNSSSLKSVAAQQQQVHHHHLLSELPAVLLIQLKRFVYDPSVGAVKLNKQIRIDAELQIPRECLDQQNRRRPFSAAERNYTLWGCVFHIGGGASQGHYTIALNGAGTNRPGGWWHVDDHCIEFFSNPDWLRKHSTSTRTPYLLMYIRMANDNDRI